MRQFVFGTLAVALALGGVAHPASQLPTSGMWIIVTHPDRSQVLVPVTRNEMYIEGAPNPMIAQPHECGGPTACYNPPPPGLAQHRECAQPIACANPPELAFTIRAWREGGRARVVVSARLPDLRAPEGMTETAIATFVIAPGETRDLREPEKWGGPRLTASAAVQ
jgi:hypothetical protein